MQSENGTITSKALEVLYTMTTNHWQDFSKEKMPTTK